MFLWIGGIDGVGREVPKRMLRRTFGGGFRGSRLRVCGVRCGVWRVCGWRVSLRGAL